LYGSHGWHLIVQNIQKILKKYESFVVFGMLTYVFLSDTICTNQPGGILAMAAHAMNQHTNCCTTSAAASTSARIRGILDTAVLAVSILVLRVGLLIV
jgi:hypothetical protein